MEMNVLYADLKFPQKPGKADPRKTAEFNNSCLAFDPEGTYTEMNFSKNVKENTYANQVFRVPEETPVKASLQLSLLHWFAILCVACSVLLISAIVLLTQFLQVSNKMEETAFRMQELSEKHRELAENLTLALEDSDILRNSYVAASQNLTSLSKDWHQLSQKYKQLSQDNEQLTSTNQNVTNNLQKMKNELEHLTVTYTNVNKNWQNATDTLRRLIELGVIICESKFSSEGRSCTTCPYGWMLHQKSCYYFSKAKKNWNDSRRYCKEMQSDLVIVNNITEQQYLGDKIEDSYWIGLTDDNTERKWLWVNNSPLNFKLPSNWYNYRNCGTVKSSVFKHLNTDSCTAHHSAICEMEVTKFFFKTLK